MTEKIRRSRFKQTVSLGDRLAEEAQRLRDQAMSVQPGIKRDQLIRKARQLETAANVNEWIASPGLVPPT